MMHLNFGPLWSRVSAFLHFHPNFMVKKYVRIYSIIMIFVHFQSFPTLLSIPTEHTHFLHFSPFLFISGQKEHRGLWCMNVAGPVIG